ncbi:MAG: MBL fold metallo-hydrolase [Chitinophagaceae bacterium]
MYNVKIFQFSPIQENTYVLYNEHKEALVIDPGCYGDNEEQELSDFIQKEGLSLKGLLNTHCHLDHVFGLKYVSEHWQLKPQFHKMESAVLEYAPVSGMMWNMPFQVYTGPVHYLEEGDLAGLESDPLQVIFTPGHSPGHICFYSVKQDFIIGGDVLFKGSVGRTDLPGGDFSTLENSIKTKLYVLPAETIVYPGHGPSTTIGEERLSNPYVKEMS